MTEATVFDDGAKDQLTGSAGQDWFFSDGEDKLTDRHAAEIATVTPVALGATPPIADPKATPVIDWAGQYPGAAPVVPGASGNGAGKAQPSWVRPFLLDLAADSLDPNAGLQVVLPAAGEPVASGGGKGRR